MSVIYPSPDMMGAEPPKSREKGSLAIAGGIIAAVVLVAFFGLLFTGYFKATPIADAAESCSVPPFALQDDGDTLVLTGIGKQEGTATELEGTVDQLRCVLSATDAPSSVLAAIGQTRALDGRQTETWDNIKASWSFHPSSGLSIIIEYDN